MTLKEITIKLDITEEHEAALLELLPHWQQYEDKDGSRPFADMTIDGLLQSLVLVGSFHTIWEKIKEEQFRQDMITTDELLDREELTVAQRKERRQQAKEGGAQ